MKTVLHYFHLRIDMHLMQCDFHTDTNEIFESDFSLPGDGRNIELIVIYCTTQKQLQFVFPWMCVDKNPISEFRDQA